LISGLILAAGLSRRMGRPKQEILFLGRPMLDYAVGSFLASKVGEVVVVLRPGADWHCPAGARVVLNPRPSAGMSSSLRVGLRNLDERTEGVLVGLGDKPALLTPTIDALIQARRESKADVVVPTFRGVRGNPVFFDKALFPRLLRLRGDQGARELVRKNIASARELAVDDPGVLLDVNVEADVRRMRPLLARLHSEGG
jgi:molybdenum cofactor cytidylyltransferase